MTTAQQDRLQAIVGSAAIKVPCKAASTANLTLSGEQTIDGVACVTGDRVLVKSQTNGVENGVYVVDTGDWDRSLDWDGTYDVVAGTLESVLGGGTVNGATMWRVSTTGDIYPGTTSVAFENAAFSSGASVSFLQRGTGAVSRTMQSKERDIVSVADFGAACDGVADDTAEIALACAAAVTLGVALFFPGLCLMSSTVSIGNTAPTIGSPITMYGAGPATGIKVAAAGINPIMIGGPAPLTDVGRYIGRASIQDMSFQGPGGFAPGGTGTGLFFNGAQGIYLNNCYFNGWAEGIKATAVDLITAQNCWFQYNGYGFYNLENAAAFCYPQGCLNSAIFDNCKVLHNATSGIYIWGGTSQTIRGCNFVANGIAINVASPAALAVAVGTQIYGNYFENSTTNDISIGGTGICRVGAIYGNTSLVATGVTAIRLFNVSNSGGYGSVHNNQMSAIAGGFTIISQAGSAETWDVDGQNGSGYRNGSVISFDKTGVLAAGSTNIFKVAGAALTMLGILTVRATSAGIATTKVFCLACEGGGNTIASVTAANTQNYSGGASAFTLTDTVDTPVAGTNTLSLNNTSAATCQFNCTLHIIQLGGVLTLL
jgi:hypothetical protein